MNTIKQEITRLQRILEGLKDTGDNYTLTLVRDEIIDLQEDLYDEDRIYQSTNEG